VEKSLGVKSKERLIEDVLIVIQWLDGLVDRILSSEHEIP
jgi:hypothetical protein